MTWWAVGVAVVAAIGTAYQQDQVAKKQDSLAAANIRSQSSAAQTASARLNELLADVRNSDVDQARNARLDDYLTTLQQGAQKEGLNTGPGGFSDAYREGTQQASDTLNTYGATRAGLLSRIDAPALQRQQEGILFDDARNDIGIIGRNAGQDNYLANLAINNTRADPWVAAGLQAAQAYGTSKASAGGGSGQQYVVEKEQIPVFY